MDDRLLKFLLIICCLINSFHVKDELALNKKDQHTLIAAMALTVFADLLMLVLKLNIWGILAFCAVQAVHNYRYTNINRVKVQLIVSGAVFAVMLFLTHFDYLASAGTSYAVFVLFSLSGAFMSYDKFPKPNYIIIVIGMTMFLLCDIFVVLSNFPGEFWSRANVSEFVEKGIWVCYLPGQVLLSSSARKINLTSSNSE